MKIKTLIIFLSLLVTSSVYAKEYTFKGLIKQIRFGQGSSVTNNAGYPDLVEGTFFVIEGMTTAGTCKVTGGFSAEIDNLVGIGITDDNTGSRHIAALVAAKLNGVPVTVTVDDTLYLFSIYPDNPTDFGVGAVYFNFCRLKFLAL